MSQSLFSVSRWQQWCRHLLSVLQQLVVCFVEASHTYEAAASWCAGISVHWLRHACEEAVRRCWLRFTVWQQSSMYMYPLLTFPVNLPVLVDLWHYSTSYLLHMTVKDPDSKMLVWLLSAKIMVYQCPVINYCTFVDTRIWHRDSVGNTAEENSSIFSLIWMPYLP